MKKLFLVISVLISLTACEDYTSFQGTGNNSVNSSRVAELIKTRGTIDNALIYAVKQGDKEDVELLIKNKANVNILNHRGEPLIIYPALEKNKDILLLLIRNGANVNAKVTDGTNLLTILTVKGMSYADIIELLIRNGADVNAKCTGGATDGFTPLAMALSIDDAKMAKFLQDNGADFEYANWFVKNRRR